MHKSQSFLGSCLCFSLVTSSPTCRTAIMSYLLITHFFLPCCFPVHPPQDSPRNLCRKPVWLCDFPSAEFSVTRLQPKVLAGAVVLPTLCERVLKSFKGMAGLILLIIVGQRSFSCAECSLRFISVALGCSQDLAAWAPEWTANHVAVVCFSPPMECLLLLVSLTVQLIRSVLDKTVSLLIKSVLTDW